MTRLILLAATITLAVLLAASWGSRAAHAWNCPPGTHDTGHSCAPNTPPFPPKPPPAPPYHQPPGRWGYCDATGKFVDLVMGQTTDLPPGVVPPLRDADVDAIVDGQQVNARCDVKPQFGTPAPTNVTVPNSPPKPVLPARKTIVKPKAKPHSKPKHHAKPKPKKPLVCKPGTRLWHGSCHHLAYGKG